MLRILACSILTSVFALIALPSKGDEKFDHGKIHVTARYLPSAPAPPDTSFSENELKVAKSVANAVEHYRKILPAWWGVESELVLSEFTVNAKRGPALKEKGSTAFTFKSGEVFDWEMNIEGNLELITGVVVHEMNHVFFADLFRKPLPRAWDEGAAQRVEGDAYRQLSREALVKAVKRGKIFSFREMISQMDYPVGATDEEHEELTTTFYVQSLFMVEQLLARKDHKTFIKFLKDGSSDNDYERSLLDNYGISAETFSAQCDSTLGRRAGRKMNFVRLRFPVGV